MNRYRHWVWALRTYAATSLAYIVLFTGWPFGGIEVLTVPLTLLLISTWIALEIANILECEF